MGKGGKGHRSSVWFLKALGMVKKEEERMAGVRLSVSEEEWPRNLQVAATRFRRPGSQMAWTLRDPRSVQEDMGSKESSCALHWSCRWWRMKHMSPDGVWDKMPFSKKFLKTEDWHMHEEFVIYCSLRYQNKQRLFLKILQADWIQLNEFWFAIFKCSWNIMELWMG